VPLDGSPRAESVLGSLGIIARDRKSELILAHAVPSMQLTYCATPLRQDAELFRVLATRNERVAAEYLERTRLRLVREGLDVRTVLGRNEDVREFLGHVAEEAGVGLIAISAHGSTGSRSRRYGAIARDLISRVHVPLLIFQDLPCRPTHRESAPARVWLQRPRSSLIPSGARSPAQG
jgi:nucleotide-binding universal stress UspA family protein